MIKVIFILNMLSFNIFNAQMENPPIKYEEIELQPIYPNGFSFFTKHILEGIQKLEISEEMNFEVVIIINEIGIISFIEVKIKDDYISQEIIKIIKSSKQWKPGEDRNGKRKVKIVLPIKIN